MAHGIAQKMLKADPQNFTQKEIDALIRSGIDLAKGLHPTSPLGYSFEDLFAVVKQWHFQNKDCKDRLAVQQSFSVMTETQFKTELQKLFNTYDENMNGGIDFGSEFDSFLVGYNSLIQNSTIMPRDYMREQFDFADLNKDGKITFEEIYPSALRGAQAKNLILTISQSSRREGNKTMPEKSHAKT